MKDALVIGIDFGTDSARAVVMNVQTGDTEGEAIAEYRRWKDGLHCRPEANQFRQHPKDYLEALEAVVRDALSSAGPYSVRHVKSICLDSTGSTPAPVDRNGTVLALLPGFENDPNAMFFLWKDHTSTKEAQEINEAASRWEGADYLQFQGYYSSEWFWAKILHATRLSEKVMHAAYTWIELCEWLPGILRGTTNADNMYRSACAAGHKALWHRSFGGLPPRRFFESIDPYLAVIHDSYTTTPSTPDVPIGTLCAEWAEKWNLPSDVVIAGSQFDAHAGAVGAGIRPGVLVKVIGTSSVDLAVEDERKLSTTGTKEYFGQAEDSILPGYIGIEAGQAAFGDVFAWLKGILLWAERASSRRTRMDSLENGLLPMLEEKCVSQPFSPPVSISLDWFNGRRYPFIGSHLKSAIVGLDLSTDVIDIYRSLVAGAAFGAKRILDGFLDSGITVGAITAIGGVARKSPFIMQTMADVLNRRISVLDTDQVCAKGCAMCAAVAARVLPNVGLAQDVLASKVQREYLPDTNAVGAYSELYHRYLSLGAFVETWFSSEAAKHREQTSLRDKRG